MRGEAGLEALLGAVDGGTLPEGACAVVEAAITQPEVVVAAAQALGRHRWPVWELVGREVGRGGARIADLPLRLEEAIRPRLEAHRHLGAVVELRDQGSELRLTVATSGPPQRGWSGDVRLLVQDGLTLDRARGRLRLAVEAGWRRELYRRAVGEALYGDPDWFCGPSVTLAPLVESAEAALLTVEREVFLGRLARA